MAVLQYNAVRGNPGETIKYIANKNKILHTGTHDVYTIYSYLGEDRAVVRVFALSHHCSTNPALAEKVMELHRKRYYASKHGGVQGLRPGHSELLGLHIYISYTVEDDPTNAVMDKIVQDLLDHAKLRDFAAYAAHHYNTRHKHTHIYIGAYAAAGMPRKLCLQRQDVRDIRKTLNKLCVEHGLSVIDHPSLRYEDPDYSAWIDGVKEKGDVTVHPAKNRRYKSYFAWMRDQEKQELAEIAQLSAGERQNRALAAKYYYTPDGDEDRRWYVSGDPQNRYYAVPVATQDGNQYTPLEQMVMFLLLVAATEGRYIAARSEELHRQYQAEIGRWFVGLQSCLQTATDAKIQDPAEIPARINAITRRLRYVAERKKHYEDYLVSREDDAEQFLQDRIQQKYAYAERKIDDYTKRMGRLHDQYFALSQLNKVVEAPMSWMEDIYDFSNKARFARGVDDILAEAARRSKGTSKGTVQTHNRDGIVL